MALFQDNSDGFSFDENFSLGRMRFPNIIKTPDLEPLHPNEIKVDYFFTVNGCQGDVPPKDKHFSIGVPKKTPNKFKKNFEEPMGKTKKSPKLKLNKYQRKLVKAQREHETYLREKNGLPQSDINPDTFRGVNFKDMNAQAQVPMETSPQKKSLTSESRKLQKFKNVQFGNKNILVDVSIRESQFGKQYLVDTATYLNNGIIPQPAPLSHSMYWGSATTIRALNVTKENSKKKKTRKMMSLVKNCGGVIVNKTVEEFYMTRDDENCSVVNKVEYGCIIDCFDHGKNKKSPKYRFTTTPRGCWIESRYQDPTMFKTSGGMRIFKLGSTENRSKRKGSDQENSKRGGTQLALKMLSLKLDKTSNTMKEVVKRCKKRKGDVFVHKIHHFDVIENRPVELVTLFLRQNYGSCAGKGVVKYDLDVNVPKALCTFILDKPVEKLPLNIVNTIISSEYDYVEQIESIEDKPLMDQNDIDDFNFKGHVSLSNLEIDEKNSMDICHLPDEDGYWSDEYDENDSFEDFDGKERKNDFVDLIDLSM